MWPRDQYLSQVFTHAANEMVVSFLMEKAPNTNIDLAYELLIAAEGLDETMLYCPDEKQLAYVGLHTTNLIFYALSIGPGLLLFRIPGHTEPVFTPLGEDWLWYPMWEQFASLSTRRFEVRTLCKIAHQAALHIDRQATFNFDF